MNEKKSLYLSLFLLLFITEAWSDDRVIELDNYIHARYSISLRLTREQINQLTWAMHAHGATPEMDSSYSRPTAAEKYSFVLWFEKKYREIPRALSRLYCLQLLREGTVGAYHRFIAPQSGLQEEDRLSRESFNLMSREIASLPSADYEVLQASAILDAVTLSPEARRAAEPLLGSAMPFDSVAFLSATAGAEIAPDVYPLVRSIISRNPLAAEQFRLIFLPNSHFPHMMYGEGSRAMFNRLRDGIREGGD